MIVYTKPPRKLDWLILYIKSMYNLTKTSQAFNAKRLEYSACLCGIEVGYFNSVKGEQLFWLKVSGHNIGPYRKPIAEARNCFQIFQHKFFPFI